MSDNLPFSNFDRQQFSQTRFSSFSSNKKFKQHLEDVMTLTPVVTSRYKSSFRLSPSKLPPVSKFQMIDFEKSQKDLPLSLAQKIQLYQ